MNVKCQKTNLEQMRTQPLLSIHPFAAGSCLVKFVLFELGIWALICNWCFGIWHCKLLRFTANK
jgi:hypothetical protein